MKKAELESVLEAEASHWARKSYAELVEDLSGPVTCQRGWEGEFHQFEVQLIEKEPDYVHVCISVDDGSLCRSLVPPTRSFIVHRDGRVEM